MLIGSVEKIPSELRHFFFRQFLIIQKYNNTVYHWLSKWREKDKRTARINVTVAAGIANVAASVLSFAIRWATWLTAV